MSPRFVESGLTFNFDSSEWPAVLRWDVDATYVGALQRLNGQTRREVTGCGRQNCRWSSGRTERAVTEATRAVDFAAVGPNQRAFLIEVKNMQGGGPFEGVDERAFKIAAKVRDSLAGIGFAKASLGEIPAPELAVVRQRLKSTSKVQVLIIFEHTGSPAQTLALRKRLESLLGWLRGDVAVVSSQARIPGLGIS